MAPREENDVNDMAKEQWEDFDNNVDRYLRREMEDDEERAFEEELHSSEEKKQRASTIAMLIKAMQEVGSERDKEIVAQIQSMSEEEFRKVALGKPKGPTIIIPLFVRYAIVACLIGIIVIGGYQYSGYRSAVNLGEANYSAYTFYEEGLSRGGEELDVSTTLAPLYRDVEEGKDLNATVAQLESLYELSKEEDSEYNRHIDDIAWNLAIGQLKRGHKKKALPYLRDIVERNQDYPEVRDVAQELIDKIEKK